MAHAVQYSRLHAWHEACMPLRLRTGQRLRQLARTVRRTYVYLEPRLCAGSELTMQLRGRARKQLCIRSWGLLGQW